MKHVLFAHSAGAQGPGEGSHDLVQYLKQELGSGYQVSFPVIEKPEAPTYAMWKKMFDAGLAGIKTPVILIGHSLGGSTLLKYLSEEQPEIKVAALFIIAAPHWGAGDWKIDDFMLAANFSAKIKQVPVYLYQSVNDDTVPFAHLAFYKKAFESAVVRELPGSDHVFAKGLPELVADIKHLP